MPHSLPSKISFVLHFQRSADARWTGRVQEVEGGAYRPFVCLESLVEELARHGVHLKHNKTAHQICGTCLRAGGTPAEGT